MTVKDYLQKMAGHIVKMDEASFEKMEKLVLKVIAQKGKVIIAGNGASAAIASHVAVDFTKTAGIRAVTFNEVDLITCFANDYGYENWIKEALKAYAESNDLVILISSSGMSPNIINAALQARAMKLGLLTFSGFRADNQLRGLGDVNLWVDSSAYNVVETAHQSWLLALVDHFAGRKKG